MVQGATTAGAGNGGKPQHYVAAPSSANELYVVIRALGVSMSGRVEATVESEPFDALEGAVGYLQNGGVALVGGFSNGDGGGVVGGGRGGKKSGVGYGSGRGRGRPSAALVELRKSRGATYELPVETQVWHVAGVSQRGNADARLMVVRLNDLKGNLSAGALLGANGAARVGVEGGAAPAVAVTNARSNGATTSAALSSQVADGLPFVDAKTFGTRVDPFMIRPNISKAAFRALLVRAIGENLADDREIYPVLDKADVQLQVANSVQYHVLAIRAPGHEPGDFYMAVDDQGRAYVRADRAKSVQTKPKHGCAFELLCQFPSLVQLKTCRCIYQEGVLYVIVFPRVAKVRSLQLSTMNPSVDERSGQQRDAIANPAVLEASGLNGAQGSRGEKRKLEDWESDDDEEPSNKTASLAVE